ncbi:unnamed protein product [Hanseniaspora opuntiae]
MNSQHYEHSHQQMNPLSYQNQYSYPSPQKSTSSSVPYPIDEYQYKEIEQRRVLQQQRVASNTSSPVLSNTSIYAKELAFFEYFGHTYNEVISDSTENTAFTPYIQLKWAITLFIFSFHPPFVQHYNINCVELHRPLNQKELHHNSRIILEHAMKVLSRLCTPINGKRNFPGGYPMALYFMGQLYSQRLDFDFLLGFFDNDPIGSQQCNINKTEYNELLKNLQINLTNNKILPLNEYNAFKYYDKCYKALHMSEEESASDWILCGSMRLFWEAWKDWKDPVSGYKMASKIFKEENNYTMMEELKGILRKDDVINTALRILKELDTPQSNFEMAKYYERMYMEERFDIYDKDLFWARSLSLDCMDNKLTSKKSLNFYYHDTTFPLNCLSISGWLLTGDKSSGLKPDDNESFSWLKRAYNCTNGARYNKVLYGLGIYHQFGIGCERDQAKCLEYMQKAAELNHPGAKKFLLEN